MNSRARSRKHASEDLKPWGGGRRLTASALALALAFTIAPSTLTWAQQPENATPPTAISQADATETPGGAGSDAPGASESETGDVSDAPAATDGVSVTPSDTGDDAPIELFDIGDPDPELPDLALDVRIKNDGTPGWDADNNAGNDSGANNGIVRVNDTVTYAVEYAVPGGTAENTTFTLKFPKGMEITQLPGFCQANGSSITPATAGTPAIPLTATSIDELSEQTLVCNRGTIISGTDIVDVTVKVLNLAHQGQDLPVLQGQIIADGFNGAVDQTLPTVKASARLMWDISKNGIALQEDTGYTYGPANTPCPWDAVLVCKYTTYSLLLSAPAGGKGAMPAVGDITLVDDLSPEAIYPDLNAVQHSAISADLPKYGSRIMSCAATDYSVPGIKVGTSSFGVFGTPTNSARDSGLCNFSVPGASTSNPGPGEPVEITISNADMSLRTYPTEVSRPVGAAIPGTEAYAVSRQIGVYTPIATIRDFGIESNNTWTLKTRNDYTGLSINGFEATDHQTIDDQPQWNDYRTTTPSVSLPGGFTKYFTGVPGAAGNMTPVEFNPGDGAVAEGLPGGATLRSGGITVAPTQQVQSQLLIIGSNTAAPAEVSAVMCDAWDNTKLQLEARDVPGSALAPQQKVPSDGAPVWISGYNNTPNGYAGTWAVNKADTPELTVQYSAAAGQAGAASQCGNDQGPWYDNPEDVPGNDLQLAADGIYSAVSRVRAHVVLPEPWENNAALGTGIRLTVAISMKVVDSGWPTGTILPNWASQKRVNFENLSMDEVVAASGTWSNSSYDPESHVGAVGDRLILAHAQARIDKQVRKGDSGAFSDTPPSTTGGDLVQYRLQPSLTSGAATPGILKDVWVEDCLPGSQIYSSATLTPVIVQSSTPADAKRPACGAGETYIRWVIQQHEVNKAVDPIIMSVTVDPTAEDGVYENTVVVWAQDDASTLAQRSDEAQIQISNIRGVRITKQPLTPVVQVNRADSDPSQRELNEWSVRFSNRLPGNAPVPNDPDIIDVLPKQGALGSDFSGTFTFHSAEVTEGNISGQAVKILYTKAANPSDIPSAASNGPSGSTTWCDAPVAGAVVSGTGTAAGCPASAAEVTAVRVQRPGPFSTGSAITFTIRMVGVDNRGGDVYVNRASGFATGLENTVRSVESPEVAIESSIGDYTWWDFNRDGVQNQWQGAPEQPATEIPVRITGTDDLGNAIDLSTTTDADGRYVFEQLRTSNGAGYTITFTKPDGTEFTAKAAGDDRAADSNADQATGIADAVVLGRDTHDLTIDAGLLPYGGVQINKAITGAGAGDFAATDTLKFQVVCTFDPQLDGVIQTEVLNQEVALPVNGLASVTSSVLGPLPAFTSCTITETDSGSADAPAAPVTVTVPWNAVTEKSGPVVASLTNYYSAGSVRVSKALAGDEIAMEAAKDKVFEILVTCQIEEDGEGGPVVATLYSGIVKVKGGQTKYLVDDNDDPRVLPLGARCFGEELNTGGAAQSTVDFDSWENSVAVTNGTPDELQALTIAAVNTFENAQLVVSKKVVGPGTGGSYDFTLVCTIPSTDETGQPVDAEYTLPEADAKFSLKDGQQRTITVPAGVTCQVAETNLPQGAKVSMVDSDDTTEGGSKDGIVSELNGTKNTVEVTNTFSPKPLVNTGGETLAGVGLLGAGMLLIGGALFFLRNRRRNEGTVEREA